MIKLTSSTDNQKNINRSSVVGKMIIMGHGRLYEDVSGGGREEGSSSIEQCKSFLKRYFKGKN